MTKIEKPLWLKNRETLEKAGCDISKFIRIRQDFHQNAEIAFKEFKTQQKLINILLSFGLEKESITKIAGTGLVVDLKGTNSTTSSKVKTIAFRADIDALPMPELNHDLPYKTITPYAHMCGHDGHMAMLLAAAQLVIKNRHKMSSKQTVRLLF